jgi:glycosyltransferase involved in cell wall biosynthesis
MTNTGRIRIAWVVHQYGDEVPGGSETLCSKVAHLLAEDVESTVLTTRSRRYDGWDAYYDEGESENGGVTVIRFPNEPPLGQSDLNRLYLEAHANPEDTVLGRRWLDANGPSVPVLREHLREHATAYDAVCALPYAFPTTLAALEAFPGPSLMVPCAHDEPGLRLDVYRRVFSLPDGLVFNTDEERRLVERRFGLDERPQATIGLWVDPPPPVDPEAFRRRHGIDGPYVVALGRIDQSKASDRLFALHEAALQRTPEHTLVMVGEPFLPIPDIPRLLVTGFVEEEQKHEALAGAAVVACPSPHESLSIAALEAWSHGCPVLANAESPVLLAQCQRSHGGLWYRDEAEYVAALRLLLERPALRDGLGYAGQLWTFETYTRSRVRDSWLDILDTTIMGAGRAAALAGQ